MFSIKQVPTSIGLLVDVKEFPFLLTDLMEGKPVLGSNYLNKLLEK